MTLGDYVFFSLWLVLCYTAIVTIVKIKTGQDLSSEYATFVAVFGGEVVTCGLIKIFKLRNEDEQHNPENRESDND